MTCLTADCREWETRICGLAPARYSPVNFLLTRISVYPDTYPLLRSGSSSANARVWAGVYSLPEVPDLEPLSVRRDQSSSPTCIPEIVLGDSFSPGPGAEILPTSINSRPDGPCR